MYKLLAIDLDGTLLNSYGTISNKNKQAIKKAKEKARAIEKESGVNLGKIVGIYENDYAMPVYESRVMGAGDMMAKSMAPEIAVSPTINPGESEVTLTVTLTYKVK